MLASRYDISKWYLNTRLNAAATGFSNGLPPRPAQGLSDTWPDDDRHSGANWAHAMP